DRDGSLEALERVDGVPYVRSWLAADLTLEAAEAGDVEAVGTLLAHVTDDAALDVVWRAEGDAPLAAGGSVEAASRAAALRGPAAAAGRRERAAAAALEVARLLRASGDTAAARPLFDEALEEGGGSVRSAAAAALVDLGGADADTHVQLAGILN